MQLLERNILVVFFLVFQHICVCVQSGMGGRYYIMPLADHFCLHKTRDKIEKNIVFKNCHVHFQSQQLLSCFKNQHCYGCSEVAFVLFLLVPSIHIRQLTAAYNSSFRGSSTQASVDTFIHPHIPTSTPTHNKIKNKIHL